MPVSVCGIEPEAPADWLALLLLILELQNSHLGTQTRYPNWSLIAVFIVSPDKFQDITLDQATTASCHSLINSVFISKHRGQVAGTLAPYSAHAGFRSWPGDQLP